MHSSSSVVENWSGKGVTVCWLEMMALSGGVV